MLLLPRALLLRGESNSMSKENATQYLAQLGPSNNDHAIKGLEC